MVWENVENHQTVLEDIKCEKLDVWVAKIDFTIQYYFDFTSDWGQPVSPVKLHGGQPWKKSNNDFI